MPLETPILRAAVHARPILWDVVEEHFREAGFLFERRQQALHSPSYRLSDLANSLESPLGAHVDGLLMGGPSAVQRILIPALDNAASEPACAAMAALTMLLNEDDGVANFLIERLWTAKDFLHDALLSALSLCPWPGLDHVLLTRFDRAASDADRAVLLRLLTGRGVDPGTRLRASLESDDPRLTEAAIQALGRFPRSELLTVVRRRLRSHGDPTPASAVTTCLILGDREAWQACLEAAECRGFSPLHLLLPVAVLGAEKDQALLYAQFDEGGPSELLLWLMGFCGTAKAADICLDYMRGPNERLAKIAADSFAWIGGVDLQQPAFRLPTTEPSEDQTLPSLNEDDLDADLSLDGVDELVVPNPDALESWWQQNRPRVAKQGRQILGQPLSMPAIVRALETGPLWRRPAVASELSFRTRGAAHVGTEAFSPRQRREITASKGAALDLCGMF